MSRVSKRDMILNSIIQAYLNDNSPIGSSELGSRMRVSMPASTIRVYFKKLSDEGEITQLHISGGRMPTTLAMQRYWGEFFAQEIAPFSINDDRVLKMLSDKAQLYTMVFGETADELVEILNLNNRFLVLNFNKNELVLKYDPRVEKFLQNLIGVGLDKLEVVCAQVGLSELKKKIRELKRSKIYFQENEILAFKMFNDERFKMILEPTFATRMNNGVTFAPLFDDGFMGLKLRVKFDGEDATMICAGSVYSDYAKFINQLGEAA